MIVPSLVRIIARSLLTLMAGTVAPVRGCGCDQVTPPSGADVSGAAIDRQHVAVGSVDERAEFIGW